MTDILTNSIWNEKQKESLKYWNQSLISEYLIKGYSLKEIQIFPKKIFDKYKIEGGFIFTGFPHGIESDRFYIGDKFDRESFNNEVKKIIDSLSLKDRLYTLEKFFFKKSREYYFIFQIHGLKGDIDFNMGDVNF